MAKNNQTALCKALALCITITLTGFALNAWSSQSIAAPHQPNIKTALSGKVANTLNVRNPYGAKHSIESEHFVYWYDDKYLGQENLLTQELERMEYSWQQLITVRGFLAPLDQYKLNIYLEQAGSSTVPFEGYSGQANIDDDGYPFIMMGAEILDFALIDARLHSTHEFFHTVQYAYGEGYGIYREQASWFGEASAGWAAIETWQMPEINANYIPFLAPTPYLSIDTDKRKDNSSGSLTAINAHHYAMAMFLYFISEHTDASLVKQVMMALSDDLVNQLPLNALDKITDLLTAEYGISLADLTTEFHRRNLLWDYPYGQALRVKQAELGITQSSRTLFSATQANNQWQYMLEDNTIGLPMSTGAVYLHFTNAQITELEFSFHDESKLQSNTSIDWRITLITTDEAISTQGTSYLAPNEQKAIYQEANYQEGIYQEANYQEIVVQGGIVDKQLITLNSNGEFWLAISPIITPHQTYTQFPFSFQFAQKGQTTAYQAPPAPVDLGNDIITDQPTGGGALNDFTLRLMLLVLLLKGFMRLMPPLLTNRR